jgi:transposase
MAIVPEFLNAMVNSNLEMLQAWFSGWLYEQMLKNGARHMLVRLYKQLDLSEIEKACRNYHHQEGPGAKARHTVGRLVRALLVKHLYNWSLRETEERIRHDLVVKWFVGYAVFEEVMDHSGLERFEQWVSREKHRVFFDEVLKQIDGDFPEEREVIQIGDTFAMQADAGREGVITLLRHTSQCLLREIEQSAQPQHAQIMAQLDKIALFGPTDEALIYHLDEAQRQARQYHTVQGVWQLGQLVRPWLLKWKDPLRTRVNLRLEDLDKIVQDEFRVERDPDGKPVQVSLLDKKDKGAYRLCSATDPAATCRTHGDDRTVGYNVSLAVTPHSLIREIQAATGAEPDQAGVAELIEKQVQYQQSCPPKLIYDQAAGAGRTRAEVAKASAGQTQLVARIPPSTVKGRFGPDAFHFDAQGALICPQQHSSTSHFHSHQDGNIFKFTAKNCAACPLWNDCRDPKANPRAPRQVFITDYQNEMAQAHAYNQTPQFKQEMKQRALVERVIFMLTHYDGARRAKSRGLERADFQAKMSATARNLRTWLNLRLRREADGLLNRA